ncbi:hypothetical protein EVAR_84957_1 [Eumeta japonica]|uniref:Uncharacterized protein n=1 Tax=Eumeta variegata TaxID=151549 RepID=A0A4C1VH85_EUMVA|nr:hypothetical protein EVAR_84957_1 [Eumeta japonica]
MPRRAPTRVFSNLLSYARATAVPRSVPSLSKPNQSSTADDLKQLMSIISVFDTNELAILAKKFRATANPTEKLISLIGHASDACGAFASFVETIKNSKF